MGYSKEHILFAYSNVSKSLPHKEMSSLWPAVLCRLRETEVYGSCLESQNTSREDPPALSTIYKPRVGNNHFLNACGWKKFRHRRIVTMFWWILFQCPGHVDLSTSENRLMISANDGASYIMKSRNLTDSSQIDFSMRACSSSVSVLCAVLNLFDDND